MKNVILLISTDGYGIEYTPYPSMDEAKIAMDIAYQSLTPNDWDEDFKEMSYVSDEDAILYANGENVYVWTIAQIPVTP